MLTVFPDGVFMVELGGVSDAAAVDASVAAALLVQQQPGQGDHVEPVAPQRDELGDPQPAEARVGRHQLEIHAAPSHPPSFPDAAVRRVPS